MKNYWYVAHIETIFEGRIFLYILNFEFIIIEYIKQNKDYTCYAVLCNLL